MPRGGQQILVRPSIELLDRYANAIPDSRYSIFYLWAKGRSRKELSRMYNLPLGTVKSQIHRAYKDLNKAIACDANKLSKESEEVSEVA